MSPTIRIDEDVYRTLQEHAEPFVDTPNTVLRRLLGLDRQSDLSIRTDNDELDPRPSEEASTNTRKTRTSKNRPPTSKRKRAPKGALLPESDYEEPILQILNDHGGRAPTREVLQALETALEDRFQPIDQDILTSGKQRWQSRAQFVRLRLVEIGDMKPDSPRGVWEISEQGHRRISEHGG